jgi:hypothetical protein
MNKTKKNKKKIRNPFKPSPSFLPLNLNFVLKIHVRIRLSALLKASQPSHEGRLRVGGGGEEGGDEWKKKERKRRMFLTFFNFFTGLNQNSFLHTVYTC